METILRKLYTFIFYCALPVIVARLLWRSRIIPDYRRRILERFGIFKETKKKEAFGYMLFHWVKSMLL